MAPEVDEPFKRRIVKGGAPRGVPGHAPLERRRGRHERGSRSLHVVEEGVISQAGEDAEPSPVAAEPREAAGRSTRVVNLPRPAFQLLADLELAQDVEACARPAELVSTVDVKDVLNPV